MQTIAPYPRVAGSWSWRSPSCTGIAGIPLCDLILHTCRRYLSFAAVQVSMTSRAQRNQVVLGIVPGSAAKLFVMNLKIRKAAAGLTSPSILLQYRPTELRVGF